MEHQLSLRNIRNTLIRLEETIIFGLIERSQFCLNQWVYQRGTPDIAFAPESLLEYMLHDCERSHAKVRRYTSPDEEPFFSDLPSPLLPALAFSDNPLHSNTININPTIMSVYIYDILPSICKPGDDHQYGSSAVNDVTLLQSLSKRIHFGKFVAECKYRETPELFTPAIQKQDRTTLMDLITKPPVEEAVLERVSNKTRTFTSELDVLPESHCVSPEAVRQIYKQWIIPLNKQVQIDYLLTRMNT